MGDDHDTKDGFEMEDGHYIILLNSVVSYPIYDHSKSNFVLVWKSVDVSDYDICGL